MRSPQRDNRWHVHRRRQRTIRVQDGIAIVCLGEANVWDYGDLVRLRQTAASLITEGHRRIGIELSHVGCLPSGFMNMVCEWQEFGLEVFLYNALPNVKQMLWFRRFTRPVERNVVRVICAAEALRDDFGFDDDNDEDDDAGSGDEIPAWADSRF